MRKVSYIYLASLAICAFLALDFLWFGVVGEIFATKLLVTIIIVNLLVFFGDMIVSEAKDEKKMKDDGFLD